MTARDVLVAQLTQYDDDAWAALANRGLLRRATKDLDVEAPSLLDAPDDVVAVRVGQHEVRLDARGPAHGICTCPSRLTCQHIITAGLWLARSGVTAPQGSPGEVGPENDGRDPIETPSLSTLHDALMSVGPDELTALAGVAGYRWARRRLDDLDPETDVRIERSRYVVVTLAHPDVTLRYLGGPVESIVADTPLAELARHQALAVLAYQRAHGADHAPVAPTAPGGSSERHRPVARSRERLLGTAARLLTDTVRIGLAHPSEALAERYESAATWAQGAELHRLARSLRRLADHVVASLGRSVGVDSEQVLDELAVTHALVVALGRAHDAGTVPDHLVGRARARYDEVRTMELVGLGGVPWRTASGYHGLTVVFWWPERDRVVSVSDARPVALTGFDPRRRWSAAGPWAGLATPASTVGALVRLSNARLSAGGRLSATEATSATVELMTGPELAALLPTVTRWAALDLPAASLLAEPDPLASWTVLAPTAWAPAEFDRVEQVLRWRLVDVAGEVLTAEVLWSDLTAPLVEAVERLSREAVRGAQLVCRLRRGPDGLTAEPMSVVRPDREARDSSVTALHFTGAQRPGRAGQGGAALTGTALLSDLPGPLREVRAGLRRVAERGTGGVAPGAVGRDLRPSLSSARAAGFDVLPLELEGDPADAVLRLHAVVLQLEAIIGHLGQVGDDLH